MKLSSQVEISLVLGSLLVGGLLESDVEAWLRPGESIGRFFGVTPHNVLSLLFVIPVNVEIYSAAIFVIGKVVMFAVVKR
jgi:hypothetical protein